MPELLAPALLITVSCFTHASWNLLAKRRKGSELAFFRGMVIASVPISAIGIAIAMQCPYAFPRTALIAVLISGAICGFYYYFLGLAYSSADFSVVYPVARALPVLIFALLEVIAGKPPSTIGWVALIMVTAGCVLAPQVSYRGFDWRRYGRRDILWMLLTAATIVGFTFFDKIGANAIRSALEADAELAGRGGPASAAIHCAFFHIFSCVSYLIVHALLRPRDQVSGEISWKLPALGGLLGYASYMLVLWAFQLADQTSYLVAFRQFSIVIGVVAAFRVYRERGLAVRLPATLAIVAGIVLVVLFG
jgi:uncharacterized membrane protein